MKRRSLLLIVTMIGWINSCTEAAQSTSSTKGEAKETGSPGLNSRIVRLLEYPVDSSFPRSMEPTGEIRQVPSRDWTSGFYPGVLWFAYEYTGQEAFKQKAEEWTALVEPEKTNAGTHDMGFKINCSFGNGYRLTGNDHYQEVIIESAKTLSTRYNENVGAVRSWDFNREEWSFPVIIDNMMNLELLFLATQLSDDSSYYQIAYNHAMTTLENHFRPDNSSWHVVDYDPESGMVKSKETHQGHSDASAWARGQAWGLYGFTMAYRFTGEEKFMDQAVEIYRYIFNHPNLPGDLIPYWDYDASQPNQPRDVSAATITASALYELSGYAEDDRMIAYADSILEVLSSEKYLVAPEQNHIFILNHSTGNMPKEDEVDVPIIYADYYFLEALLRKKELKEK